MKTSSRATSAADARASGPNATLRYVLPAVLAIAVLSYLFIRPPSITAGGIDFNAFFCASRTLATGENPYAYEPLRACEHANRHWNRPSEFVEAPLPPYALALLAPLSALPYPQASFVWFLLLITAAGVMIWAIIQMTGLSLLPVGVPISIAVLLQSLPTGALAPIALALLCAAAVALMRKSWMVAAVLLGFACIEPHVAAPVMLAVFVLVRQMRVLLAIIVLDLIVISLAFGGPGLTIHYFSSVLPAHAAFELGSITQFSLSSMLHNFGVPNRAALAIGSVQYLAFVLLGIWLASRLRRVGESLIVLIPMALAVTGGVYIHLTQIAAVLPLAFFVAGRTRSPFAWASVVFLAIPWNLLNAFTASTLIVPPAMTAASSVIGGRGAPGGTAYLANFLVYLAIGCTFFALLSLRQRRDVALNPN